MKEFVIEKNDAGQRVDKFITKAVPLLPQSLLYKYIRTKRIKLNGKRTEISARLNEGDALQLYINDEFFAPAKDSYDFLRAGKQLDILYEDENVLLLDKKAGLLSHPDEGEYNDTLITRVQRYLYEKGEYDPKAEASFAPALVNRIDRNTGGIVIAAKNAEALRVMNQIIRDNELQKYYLCIVKGCPKPKHAVLTAYHFKDENTNTVRISDQPREGYKKIVTEYTVIKPSSDLSVCEVLLHTGRTHQIRAHMAHIGHPLLGDEKYGDRKLNARHRMKRQALYSYKLKFCFTTAAGCLDNLNNKTFEVKQVPFLDKV